MTELQAYLPTWASLWKAYTQEVLTWNGSTDSQDAHIPCEPITQENLSRAIARTLHQGARNGASLYILLGCDIHALREFEAQLSQADAHQAPILILETSPQRARTFLKNCAPLSAHVHLLVDTSPWALFTLTRGLGLDPQDCNLFHCFAPKARCSVLEKWRKLFLGAQREEYVQPPLPTPRLSVAAIMHPTEPHMEDFFAHIPEWVHEVVIMWDAQPNEELPPAYACAAPVTYFSRPLCGSSHASKPDFAAQRNAMLAQCSGEWVLYMDADERFSENTWNKLPHFMHSSYAGGVVFPRITFEKDANHARMGYGLWPDVQLRMFPRTEKVHFIGSVHERVEGLEGAPVVSTEHSILHYSHIFKTEEQLRDRLAIFTQAGTVHHTLSAAYPHLPMSFFEKLPMNSMQKKLLRLPA